MIARFMSFYKPGVTVDPTNTGKICKLQKSIYGLEQASRSWNIHFDEVVKGFGFIKTKKKLVFIRRKVEAMLHF